MVVGLKRTALRRVCAALLCSVLLLTLLLFLSVISRFSLSGEEYISAVASYFCPALPAYAIA